MNGQVGKMWDSKGKDEFSGTALAVRCYESHPVLKMGKGRLYGGSASHPVVKDADIYVALQSGSTSGQSSDPWEVQRVVEVHYTISDMYAPKDVPRFKKLVTWLCNQLQSGKKVHVGCVGGHGRTGIVLSAVVAEALEKKDAIQWVRKHYCKKAVESKTQIQFLMKHYGVSEVEPSKGEYRESKSESGWFTGTMGGSSKGTKWDSEPFFNNKPKAVETVEQWKSMKVTALAVEGVTPGTKSFTPMSNPSRSLWKAKKRKK